MRIFLENSRIRVKGTFCTKFTSAIDDVDGVFIQAGSQSQRSKLSSNDPKFRYLTIWSGKNGVVLDAVTDTGFNILLDRLKNAGWDVDGATEEALRGYLCNIPVAKRV